jgi:hypothetical protein
MNEAYTSRSEARFVLLQISLEARRLPGESVGGWAPSTGELQGLCVNCDRRYDCTYPKPAGGVRSCDEYV